MGQASHTRKHAKVKRKPHASLYRRRESCSRACETCRGLCRDMQIPQERVSQSASRLQASTTRWHDQRERDMQAFSSQPVDEPNAWKLRSQGHFKKWCVTKAGFPWVKWFPLIWQKCYVMATSLPPLAIGRYGLNCIPQAVFSNRMQLSYTLQWIVQFFYGMTAIQRKVRITGHKILYVRVCVRICVRVCVQSGNHKVMVFNSIFDHRGIIFKSEDEVNWK